MLDVKAFKEKLKQKVVRPTSISTVSKRQEQVEESLPFDYEMDFEVIEFDTMNIKTPELLEFKLFSIGVQPININQEMNEIVLNPRKLEYDSDEELELRQRCELVSVDVDDIVREANAYVKRQSEFITDEKKVYPKRYSKCALRNQKLQAERLRTIGSGSRGGFKGGFRGRGTLRGNSRGRGISRGFSNGRTSNHRMRGSTRVHTKPNTR